MTPVRRRSGESRNPFSLSGRSNMDSGFRRNDEVACFARMEEVTP
jgi:hypothetical protein